MVIDDKVAIIIPARMAASRFPGKPLVKILDLPMIEHVRRRMMLCDGVKGVYVATCDDEIREVVEGYDGKVIMTSDKHERCTGRIAEAAQHIDCNIVVNIQGDEPCVLPECASDVAAPLLNSDVPCSCLIYPVNSYSELSDTNLVKAVLSQSGSVLYFSRNVIPSRFKADPPAVFKQSGIMAYRKEFLHTYAAMPQTPLEKVESVDMLRLLENDYTIRGIITSYETPGVDVPGDVAKIEELIRSDPAQQKLYRRICKQ